MLLPFSDEPFNFIPIKNNAFFDEYWENVERKKVSKSLKINRYKSTKIILNRLNSKFERRLVLNRIGGMFQIYFVQITIWENKKGKLIISLLNNNESKKKTPC